jgi:predicted small lipoprotein YifL
MSRYLKAMSLLALSSGIALAGCGQSAPENAPKGNSAAHSSSKKLKRSTIIRRFRPEAKAAAIEEAKRRAAGQ